MPKRDYPLSRVYGLLEPGPVLMLSTRHKDTPNVMVMSWHTMMEFEPPLVGCVVSNRNFSFQALTKTRRCVLNIPTIEIASKVVACGNCSGREIDKFATFHLAYSEASTIDCPIIDDCYANLECIVRDTRLVNRYNFFVLEVKKAIVDPSKKIPQTLHHMGWGKFSVGGKTIELPSKMR